MSKRNNVFINSYPYNKDFVFTIAIDDLHPESKEDAEHLDFGSSTKKDPLRLIEQTIKENPDIKFTLFTVPQWIDRSDVPSGWLFPLRKLWRRRRNYGQSQFDISQKKFEKWIKDINLFYPKNIEIALHGLFHHTDDTKYFRSEEFGGLSEKEIAGRIEKMEELFDLSHLRHSRGFRPPGWLTPNELVSVLKKRKFLYLAATSDMHTPIEKNGIAKSAGLKEQYLLKETNNYGMYNFTANCYPHQIQRAVDIARQKGILMVHCHIASTEFGLVAVNKKYPQQIRTMLQEIKYQTGLDPWFANLEELAMFLYAKERLQWEIKKESIIFQNYSPYDLRGLTIVVQNILYIIPLIRSHEKKEITLAKTNEKKVSIVLTVYNGEKTVEDSLHSLTTQTYPNTEIIVVNDGSTDNSEKIITPYIKQASKKNITVMNQINKGRAAAKNVGLHNATGEFVAFCEDDAIYTKNYIAKAVAHFKDNNTLGVIGPHFVWNKNESIMTRAKDVERRRSFKDYHPFSAWVYRKSDLEKIGGFNELLEFGEDVEPAKKLKKLFPKKSFVFEEQSIWLHKEPSHIYLSLKRKYKGGVGMALLARNPLTSMSFLQKTALLIFPFIVLIGCIFLVVIQVFFHPSILFYILLCFLGILGLLLLRKKDIQKSITISSENIFTICLYILIEYLWWFATLLGMYSGFLLSQTMSKGLLRKR